MAAGLAAVDDVLMGAPPDMNLMLSAGATAAAGAVAAAVVTTTVASAATASTISALPALSAVAEIPIPIPIPTAAAWDAHLDNPLETGDAAVKELELALRRTALGLASDNTNRFIDAVEFVSLGCFCAASSALQMLGLKRNAYPLDWVRSSLDGVLHCLDERFEDFLSYSTYTVQGQYVVFGGARWGGSFWHHNLEVPVTRSDMARRVSRFYGHSNVSPCTPRLFVRIVNSSRELNAVPRLRQALCEALPDATVLVLTIVDMQAESGAAAISGKGGDGLLFYMISEAESQHARTQTASAETFRICSETYAKAIAFGVRYWSGDVQVSTVAIYESVRKLCAACVQFEGGDPGRELFAPRKFYGQALDAFPGPAQLQSLFAKMRSQTFVLPEGIDLTVPYRVECFGKCLSVTLPPDSRATHFLNIILNDTALTADVACASEGKLVAVGPAVVQETPWVAAVSVSASQKTA